MMHAKGTFEISATASPPYDTADGARLSRTNIAKTLSGDLEATSVVEMLSATTDVKGSAGYVALERVHGALHGKHGTFVLQHSGTMTRGTPTLSVTVVPDSGTAGLKGIAGTMTIDIVNGKHSYTFDYVLGS